MKAELVFDAKARHGEGPVWHEVDQTLDWVDIAAGRIHRFDPTTARESLIEVGQPVGAFAACTGGGFVLAVEHGFARLDADGRVTPIAAVTEDTALRMNDGKCDPGGRFWAGTMAYDFTAGAGSLYRLDFDGTVTIMVEAVTISNGLDWSRDGATMYYIDSLAGGIDAFDFDADRGNISGRRRIIDISIDSSVPTGVTVADGMTIDADGNLWVAVFGAGEVRQYTPGGEMLSVIELPVCAPTSCAFGGAHLKDLYITTNIVLEDGVEPGAGGLFRARPGPAGTRARRFGG